MTAISRIGDVQLRLRGTTAEEKSRHKVIADEISAAVESEEDDALARSQDR